MATRIAWWLNLDAGLELAQPVRYVRSRAMEARLRALAPQLRLLLDADDVILDGSQHAAELGECVPLTFCPTPSALEALRALGFGPPSAPTLALLRKLTRRAFAASLGQPLPGARYVESMAELENLLRERSSFSGEWLIKRDFSFAGRERRRVRNGQLDLPTAGFVERSFTAGEGLQVEPYVERLGDFARHGFVLPGTGELLRGPVLAQTCDARGVWQGSTPAAPSALSDAESSALEQALEEAGQALAREGYHGPFGIDAFRYRDARGDPAFQPRSEINVRFSMGYPRGLLERALSALKRQSRGGCD